VISYDRRGFGRSDQPWSGYDYDTLADDLDTLMRHLDLREATLIGFSMGGGEVARCMSRHGTARVAQAVLMSAVTPSLKKSAENPEGIDESVFGALLKALEDDRAGFLADFREGFFNGASSGSAVSRGVLDWYSFLASQASLRATVECARAWADTDADSARQCGYQCAAGDHGSSRRAPDCERSLHRIRRKRSRYWHYRS
jgi:pimeloyl-ACP methyl ester carboxylesterase